MPPYWVFRDCICPKGNRGGGAAPKTAIDGYELKPCLCPLEEVEWELCLSGVAKQRKRRKGRKEDKR